MRLHLIGAMALIASMLLLAACDRAPRSGVELRTDDPKVLALGQAVYQARCASCHGAKLEGQPNWRERDASGRLPAPPHDASGHTWHHPDQVLFDIVKHGVGKAAHLKDYDTAMPVFEGTLSDAEIIAVLSWIKSQWPADTRKRQEEVDRAARRNAAEG
jgi:S-disulfanyl-L-cysteine oxidoreductase SoxD